MRLCLLMMSAVVVAAGCSSSERPAPVDRCAADTAHGDLPSWSASARPPSGVRTAVAEEGDALAVVFGDPLRAGERHDGVNNKVLWVVREARDGKPLHITATLPGTPPVEHTEPADSGPGEIYPSIVDVPVPGCWTMALDWNGHHATVALRYEP
jgi:hypothetical protein